MKLSSHTTRTSHIVRYRPVAIISLAMEDVSREQVIAITASPSQIRSKELEIAQFKWLPVLGEDLVVCNKLVCTYRELPITGF